MKRAVNPQTGEVVFLVNDQWVSPSQTAVNEAGDKAYLVNNQWIVPPPPAPTPEPILTPEEQMTAPVGADTTGGVQLSDYGKLFGAGAIKSTLGAPEAIQAGTSGISRDTTTKPTEILNYLADPRKLANDLAQAVRLPKIFEDDAKMGIVPEKTIAKQKAAVDEALTKGKLETLRDLTNYGTKISAQIEDSVTPEMKQALADSQPTGNIIEALQTGDFSKISLGADPSVAGIAGQAAKVFGSTAPSLLIGVVAKSPVVGGVAGFGQAGSEGVETAREHIKSMSNEELAEKSEYFRNLLVLGYKPEMARKMTEEKAADTAAYYQGMVGALGNQFTSNLLKGNLDDVLLKSASSRLTKILKGTTVGMTEEGLQELAEGVATDLGIDRTVVRELGVDSFANIVLGAIGGGGPGGVRGAIAKDKTEVPPVAPPTDSVEVAPSVTPVTPETTPPATPVAAVPPVPQAPVSGAISEEELETAEEPAAPKAAKPSEAMVAIVDEDGNVTDELDKVDLNDLYEEDGKIYVRGEFYDHDLMSVLADLKDEGQKMELVKRAENLMPKAPETAIETPEIKEAPEVPAVEDDAIRMIQLQKRFSQAEESGALPKAQANQVYKLMEKEQLDKAEALLDKFLKLAEEKKAKEAPKATEVLDEEKVKGLPTAEDVDVDKNLDRLKELSARRDNDEELTDEEDALLDAAHRKVYLTAEKIKSPPPKKGYASRNHIDVNQVGGKWVAGSGYMGKVGGYSTPVSYDSDAFDSREEAINAEIDKMRPYAQSQDDKQTLKWLDSLDTRKAKVPAKEDKAAANRKRQEEQKIAAEQAEEDITEAEEAEEEDADEDARYPDGGTYDVQKDKDAEVIQSPDGRIKLFVKEITDPRYPKYVGRWLFGQEVKTTGGWMGGHKTPKSTPDSAPSRKEAIKSALQGVQVGENYLNKKGKFDQSVEDFVQEIAKKEGIELESYAQRQERYKKEAAEVKAAANRKRQEEKKAKAAEEKAAAKKKEEESWAAEVKQKQEFEAAQRKKSAEENARRKEVEDQRFTEFEDDTGIPSRELKEVNALVDETEEEYGDAVRNYIKTGKGKDLIEKARVKHDKAIQEFNKTVREIRSEEEAEEAPKVEEKPKAKPKAKEEFKKLRGTKTEDGFKVSNPIMTGLVDIGYEMLDLRNPRTYVDKNGTPFRTFEKNGVRIALEPGKVLFKQKGKEYGRVGTAIGNENDVTIEHLFVDPEFRKQGLAKQALKDITFLADKSKINMYLEPAELEKGGMTKEQLSKLYSEFLWKPTNESGSPMKRVPESYEEAMARINAKMKAEGRESDYSRLARELEELKSKTRKEPVAGFDSYVEEVSDQIDNLVDLARIDLRTGITREEIIKRLKASYDESPEKAQSILDNTEDNMLKAAQKRLLDDLKADFREATGKPLSKEADLVRAIKSGVLDVSGQENAEDIYKVFDIKKSDIKKAATGAGVPALIDKFGGSFFGRPKEVSEEVYDEAAKQFLEGDLKAKVPTGKMDTINAVRLQNVTPKPVEKNIKAANKTFDEQSKVLFQIAPKQEIRLMLTGIHVDRSKNRLVATDGHRLAAINNASLKDAPKGTDKETVINRDGKYMDVQYPDVDRVIPKEHAKNKLTFDVKGLGDHARGANKAWRYISSKMAAPIQVSIGSTVLSFNAKYIEDMSNIFRQMGYDKAEISMADGRLYATSPDGKVQQVIMSMRDENPLFARYALDRGMVISGEGLIREITNQERKLLTNSTNELDAVEQSRLEKFYGAKRDTDEFLQKLREDATKYINDGAEAVDKAIRSIIAKVAAAILSVAIVFNPNYMSDASAVALPQVVTQVVQAEVPTEAKGMSESGKKAYATLYPALKKELQKNNKYFTVVDKPTSNVYVFNPDGSLMTQSTVVLGKAFGDTYVGKTDFKENRITPAGLFKPKAEKGSATYDGKTVYTLDNVKEGWNAVFMHTVYLKESDAKDRLKALETGEGTRLSYGCINGPTALMDKIDNESMNESHMFIVPDNQAATDDYIANRVSNEDLTRETVTPVTKKAPAPRAKTMTEQEVFGREEELALAPRKTQAEINRDRQQARKAAATSEDKGIFFGNFVGEMSEADKKAMREEIREEKIMQKGVISRKISTIVKKIASVGGDLETQKRLNYLTSTRADLTNYIKATKPERRSADWFRARAADELAKGNLMPETMAVVDELYKKYPSFLEGLKLSVQAGKRVGVEGSFEPIQRLVTIYKNPFSVTQDETMRHEIMHSLEQMMTPEAQIALVNAWADALSKAMKKHTDEKSQLFFNAVLDYIENPTKANYRKATNKMPYPSFYQYMNPSEFWAVNGEKLMKSQLGNSWDRFVKGVKKILEALKNVFGFDNRYAVHREFYRLMKGESGQMTDTMLADYLKQNDVEIEFLNQVEDVDELLDRHDRPDTPLHPSDSVKDKLLDRVEDFKDYRDRVRANPRVEVSNMVGSVDRAVTYARNKNVWFGTGLELADLKKYNGQLRDGNGFAVASIALTNALHAGHVATQVVTHGGLRFDPVTQQFTAYDSKYSLANVVREKMKLVKQLGEQRATNLINSFFEAKRSRSIQNEFYNRQAEYETLKQKFEAAVETEEKDQLYKDMVASREALERVSVAMDKVNMTDEAIDDFIAMEKKFPELRAMMKNWTAVNQNMIDNMEFAGIISKKRAAQLREIEDYVPWYRIQDEMEDPHDPVATGVRGLTNVGKEKKFKKGATDKDIDDIVDNMIHNVMMTTRNSMRNYAANRVAMEYATRNDKGKIKVFPKEGVMPDGSVRANILANGRRIVIEIKDPLIAEAVLGMESIEIPMYDVLGMMANGLRRGITSFPIFQVKQLFMDAPTAAWVSGVKNPFAVWGKTFASFVAALNPNDPIVKMMKSYGIGGYQSSARTPEKELKLQIGLIGRSPFARMMKILDHIGDASDYAQRRAIYKQVLKETGDEMQALIQANNVIDFLKHGSAKHAQFLTRTVSFMNAYAQSVDVLAQSMAGGGLKGKERSKVFAQFVKTGMILAGLSLLYSFAVGDDEEYQKMDDQTKLRNFIIPKSLTKLVGMENSVKIPMHTTASFFFKSMPELLYNKIMNEGTKNHMDNQRLRTALREAAVDALLGPNVTPTGVKPFLEIGLNRNFFTGGTLTPKGMENLESFRQYTASTSELGKIISKGTFGVLNPIEADHLMKSLLGTIGASAMWGSNLFSGDRVEPNASSNPLYGAFVSAPVPRGPEDIYYDLKERSTKVHDTFIDMMKKGRKDEANKYRKENEALFKAYGYTNGVEQGLKAINAEIRRIGDLPGDKLTGAQKRERITYYQNKKNEILKDVIEYRKRAGL